ncbi:ABC transporter substrate-binding protein [Aeromicrobium sp. PE09-221]|uniref:extracellular solute-binding protein n=1 Tax=Aeromicrobium sp. PE09-221 TaxID=1898043 RepID=UPI000B3EE04D|nr:extracellular solute-binding protein [Aeromicrobium sp. PE09-221]OUZ09467.1 ABC transporter substrate-binding protein [Aeromicrobium sp. PE09-221]
MKLALERTALVLAAALALSACGSNGGQSDIVADTSRPSEVPAEMVTEAEAEGEVVVYTNSPDEVWDALIPKFQEAYPGITISPVSLNGPELVQRLRSEQSSGAATADLIIDSSPSTLFDLADAIEERESTFAADLPDYANPRPGVYAISADPSIITYNKAAVGDNAPESLADVAALAADNQGKLATYDIDSENGYAQMWTLAQEREDAWALYDELAPSTRYELNGGSMTQKLAQGEYIAGYFQSGLVRGLLGPSGLDSIVGWSYEADGTTVVPRYAAVVKGAAHPNAAALLQDYLLSAPGQTVACSSGLTAVRDDVADACGDFALKTVSDEVGEDNIVMVPLDESMRDDKPDFSARLAEARGR